MSSTVAELQLPPADRRPFADRRPWFTPDSLDNLHGPRSGLVWVSAHINTAPEPVYNFDDPAELRAGYSAIVQEAIPGEHEWLLDKELLLKLWPDLFLPRQCRAVWIAKFPEELGSLPVRALSL
ncbi:MAG: hypothetical protein LBC29_06660 [Propionibacteriaceae bacterium]|jgi:hypothetical protein|nr:hypothetical protein [Propionibacteriaceae bacterium]